MGEATDSRPDRGLAAVLTGLLIALAAAAALTPPIAAAESPYEPNDSVLSAAGPLPFGETATAVLETPGDRDFFYFYVTSARPAKVALTATNLGGGTVDSGVNAAIVDSLDNALDAFAYALAGGKEATGTITLAPGKYFVDVRSVEGSSGGISYSLAPGGDAGAFGPYAQIAARCASATAGEAKAKRRLNRAQSKLQRAVARVQRSIFSDRAVRRGANVAKRKAKAQVTVRRRALKAARKSLSPWCSIPR